MSVIYVFVLTMLDWCCQWVDIPGQARIAHTDFLQRRLGEGNHPLCPSGDLIIFSCNDHRLPRLGMCAWYECHWWFKSGSVVPGFCVVEVKCSFCFCNGLCSYHLINVLTAMFVLKCVQLVTMFSSLLILLYQSFIGCSRMQYKATSRATILW